MPGGGSRRASTHRPGAPTATRARKALSLCQSAATASAPNSPSATTRRTRARSRRAPAGVQFQQRGRRGPGTGRRRRRGTRDHGQGIQFGRECAVARGARGASADGIEVGHAIFQARRECEPHAAAGPARYQHQARAIVDQVFASGDVPELEGIGIGRRVGIRVELHHRIVIGEPGRMRVARIQGGIFQQAQSPARGGLWPAASAQPVAAVVGVAAQVFTPARGRRGAACRDTRRSDTSVRRSGSAMTQPPVIQQERRHGFRRAGAIESPSSRHRNRDKL